MDKFSKILEKTEKNSFFEFRRNFGNNRYECAKIDDHEVANFMDFDTFMQYLKLPIPEHVEYCLAGNEKFSIKMRRNYARIYLYVTEYLLVK